MKKIISLYMVALLLLLGACSSSSDTTEKEIKSASGEEKTQKDEAAEQAPDDNQKKDLNQAIADNENVKVTLLNVEKVVDKEWDEEKFLVNFEVENKREDTIDVQAREVSADGKMVDDSMLNMSTEISGGKKADATLTIQNYDGDLPALEENLEMILYIFSWDHPEFEETHNVTINLK